MGQFAAGSLDNGGETLALVDGAGREIVSATYSDGSLWPQAADGVGATLELIDQAQTPASQSSKYYRWRGSTDFNGSPGARGQLDSAIAINEILANTDPALGISDAIELMNTGTSSVDVSGWYVSDSASRLLKYQLPLGTVLPAGGYLVLTETDFNPTPDSPQPHHFSLNGSSGDDVWLTVADAQGSPTQFVDDVHFGPTISGESLGRIPNGTGLLSPLVQRTLGRSNQDPRIGPLVISEVMYHAAPPSAAALAIDPLLGSGNLEFIEISNPTRTTMDLIELAASWWHRVRFSLGPNARRRASPCWSFLLTRRVLKTSHACTPSRRTMGCPMRSNWWVATRGNSVATGNASSCSCPTSPCPMNPTSFHGFRPTKWSTTT